jgi:hypothetical protein
MIAEFEDSTPLKQKSAFVNDPVTVACTFSLHSQPLEDTSGRLSLAFPTKILQAFLVTTNHHLGLYSGGARFEF